MTMLDGTLSDWLTYHAKARPDQAAIIDGAGTLTYADLHTNVQEMAAGLANLDIGKGDVVAAQLPNTRAFVTALLATAARGAIFQTLHMPYRRAELHALLKDACAKVVILTHNEQDSRTEDVLALRADLPGLAHIIVAGSAPDGCHNLDTVSAPPVDPPAITTGDPYLLLYTSGTTGAPKGVPHAYRAFLDNAAHSAAEMQIDDTARILSLAPMTHLYGLFTLHLSLAVGATAILHPAFNPATLLDDLANAQASHIFAAPAHFAPFVAKGALTQDHLASAHLLCLSGAAVPPSLAKAVDSLMPNGKVIQLWGMSELQAGSFGRPTDPATKRFTTAGAPSPGTKLRVLDDTGTPLPPEQEGALQVKGPSVFAGYLNHPEETARAFDDGWFATGDLAKIDVQGFLTITGRTKEVINRGGVKFNPTEIEDILTALPAILQCAIIPLPDPDLGERGCLCVQLTKGATLTLEDVTNILSNVGLAKYKWPERLILLDDMPLTPTRKIKRGDLIAQLKDTK